MNKQNDLHTDLNRTPLFDLHRELGAKMTGFAGYDMPVQYPDGVLKEHLHTRAHAGLFDVSHMGQASLVADTHEIAATALERLVPGEIQKLGVMRQRYTVLLNEQGGIVDDLMVSRGQEDGRIDLVVNAACKEKDYAYIKQNLTDGVRLERHDQKALLAIQGPQAVNVLSAIANDVSGLKFMSRLETDLGGISASVVRSGYTGEDGYEISIAASDAETLARMLLEDERCKPIGLGARDSLRLEAGLCLYGHDISDETSPVEGNIRFAVGKRRRLEGGFPGAERIRAEFDEGPSRLRVGISPEGRAPAREGTEIWSVSGDKIGVVTSGGFGPTVSAPIAMGYVGVDFSEPGTNVNLMVRGKSMPATVVEMPFAPHRYFRG